MPTTASTSSRMFGASVLAFACGLAAIVASVDGRTVPALILALAAAGMSVLLRTIEPVPTRPARVVLGSVSGAALVAGLVAWSEGVEVVAYAAVAVIVVVTLIETQCLDSTAHSPTTTR